MPGFLTHCIFSEKTAARLIDTDLHGILEEYAEAYLLGSQGPDIFFYNPLSHLQHGYRNTGVYMHEHDTTGFFRNCLLQIQKTKEEQVRSLLLAYLCGFICHHYLDRTAHPYIYWYTYQLKGNRAENSFRIHSGIETNIDGAYACKYKHTKPCSIPRRDLIDVSSSELHHIAEFLSASLQQTWRPAASGRTLCFRPAYIRLTIKGIQIGQSLLKDRSGRKKKMIQLLERHLLPHPLLTGMMINDQPDHFGDYMNLAHQTWTNPWDPSARSAASFPELFHQAVLRCADILRQLTPDTLRNAMDPDAHIAQILEQIGDYSYLTGLPNVPVR